MPYVQCKCMSSRHQYSLLFRKCAIELQTGKVKRPNDKGQSCTSLSEAVNSLRDKVVTYRLHVPAHYQGHVMNRKVLAYKMEHFAPKNEK